MELKEFVTAALLGVIDGVSDAKRRLGDRGVHVNPSLSTQQGELQRMGRQVSQTGLVVHSVEFDIAVGITHSASNTSHPAIGVVSGLASSTATEQAGHNRMKFAVPITFPSD